MPRNELFRRMVEASHVETSGAGIGVCVPDHVPDGAVDRAERVSPLTRAASKSADSSIAALKRDTMRPQRKSVPRGAAGYAALVTPRTVRITDTGARSRPGPWRAGIQHPATGRSERSPPRPRSIVWSATIEARAEGAG